MSIVLPVAFMNCFHLKNPMKDSRCTNLLNWYHGMTTGILYNYVVLRTLRPTIPESKPSATSSYCPEFVRKLIQDSWHKSQASRPSFSDLLDRFEKIGNQKNKFSTYHYLEEGKIIEIMRGSGNTKPPVVEAPKSTFSLPAVTAEEAAMGYE